MGSGELVFLAWLGGIALGFHNGVPLSDKILQVIRGRFHACSARHGGVGGRIGKATKQPPAKAGRFGLRTESPDTRRLNDAF